MVRYLVPFVLFLLLAIFLGIGLNRDPREVPSPLIDKPAPAFRLPQLHEVNKVLAPEDMKGKVWLFNVWASWCVACLDEHPILVDLARRNLVPIVGLNYKDEREAALKWLQKHGNPYTLSAQDGEGRVGIDYGVYGVPETYLIDQNGVIRFKKIGAVTPRVVEEEILPLIRKLQG
jgi:cytochrome c biogenesis protein CcmG, thiol:disulfide interchange protein DsbE